MSQKNENPLNGIATIIQESNQDLTVGEKFDAVMATPEGQELLAKKDGMTQIDFQIALLAIKEKYNL